MQTFFNVLIIILIVLVVLLVALYFFGRKAQKKQAQQQEQMEAMKQTVSMLVIDKKRMKLKDSGLPQMVIDQTPRLMRGAKMPIVKAKVGPKVMTLVADANVFDLIPVKKEVKATISGIYITAVKGVRGPLESVSPKKKKGLRALLKRNAEKASSAANANSTKKTKKK